MNKNFYIGLMSVMQINRSEFYLISIKIDVKALQWLNLKSRVLRAPIRKQVRETTSSGKKKNREVLF